MAKRLIENYSKRDRRGLVSLPLNGTQATGWVVMLGGHQLFVEWHTGEVWILTAEEAIKAKPYPESPIPEPGH